MRTYICSKLIYVYDTNKMCLNMLLAITNNMFTQIYQFQNILINIHFQCMKECEKYSIIIVTCQLLYGKHSNNIRRVIFSKSICS